MTLLRVFLKVFETFGDVNRAVGKMVQGRGMPPPPPDSLSQLGGKSGADMPTTLLLAPLT